MKWQAALLLASLILLALPFTLQAVGQQDLESQAQQLFESKGCTSCHSWDSVKSKVIEWAQNYDTLDDAAFDELGYDSFEDLMDDMAGYVGGLSDDELQLFNQYFMDLFNQSKPQQGGGGEEQPPANETQTPPVNQTNTTCQANATVTVTVTTTVTKTKTVTDTITETIVRTQDRIQYITVTVEPPEARQTPGTAMLVPIISALLVVAAAAYLFFQARG